MTLNKFNIRSVPQVKVNTSNFKVKSQNFDSSIFNNISKVTAIKNSNVSNQRFSSLSTDNYENIDYNSLQYNNSKYDIFSSENLEKIASGELSSAEALIAYQNYGKYLNTMGQPSIEITPDEFNELVNALHELSEKGYNISLLPKVYDENGNRTMSFSTFYEIVLKMNTLKIKNAPFGENSSDKNSVYTLKLYDIARNNLNDEWYDYDFYDHPDPNDPLGKEKFEEYFEEYRDGNKNIDNIIHDDIYSYYTKDHYEIIEIQHTIYKKLTDYCISNSYLFDSKIDYSSSSTNTASADAIDKWIKMEWVK